MKTWQKVLELINNNQNFLVVSHKNPDGDSIGSEIALAMALMKLKKNVYIYNSDPPPKRYSKFPKASLIQTEKKNFKEDVTIFVDCAEIDRIGKIKETIDFSKPSINIDHHVGNTKFGTVNLMAHISDIFRRVAAYKYALRIAEITRLSNKLMNLGVG